MGHTNAPAQAKVNTRYTVHPDGHVEPLALQHVGCIRDARLAYNAFLADNAAGAGRRRQADPQYARDLLARHAGRPQGCNRPNVAPGALCGECIQAQATLDALVAPAVADDLPDRADMAQIGSGAFRRVYRRSGAVGSRFVYKVSHYKAQNGKPVERDNQYNEGEYCRLTDERAAGHTWATPISIFYVNGIAIVAMPFVPQASGACKPGEYNRLPAAIRREDMHGQNYRATATGRLRVTDLGPVRW